MAGAVLPGTRLDAAVISSIPDRDDLVVVELGAGSGRFTSAVQRRLRGRGRHLAVAVDHSRAGGAGARFPAFEAVTADATRLPEILLRRGLTHADVVVSDLPWATYGEAKQRSILTAVSAVLRPDGVFTALASLHARPLPAARRFRRLLEATFHDVTVSRPLWSVMPPTEVYRAQTGSSCHTSMLQTMNQMCEGDRS